MRKSISGRALVVVLATLGPSAGTGLAATRAAAPAAAPAAPAHESNIDPAARDALTRMSNYLRSLQAFSIHEDVTSEQVIDGDMKVQKSTVADVRFRRPDRLKAEVLGDDDKNHTIYFDGNTVTVYLPAHNYYAQMDSPGDLGSALDAAESRYGIEFPTPDFLRTASREDLADGLTAAGYVGASRIAGVDCEHYAYRTAEVDYQLWFEKGGSLPRKLVITSKKEPAQPEYSAAMTWDVSPKIEDAAFVFTPPQGATKIPFGVAVPRRRARSPGSPGPHGN
ncbi:MAG TPA: DUF2092 domain-containing protein [Polyangiaceae bacterium]|nr:DUF2092 domain-containing protein [Polyangiaceae bacterium]